MGTNSLPTNEILPQTTANFFFSSALSLAFPLADSEHAQQLLPLLHRRPLPLINKPTTTFTSLITKQIVGPRALLRETPHPLS